MPTPNRWRAAIQARVGISATALTLLMAPYGERPSAAQNAVLAPVPLTRASSTESPRRPPPIPPRGPFSRPKALQQVGVPVQLSRDAIPPGNPQTPEKIALGEKLFFDGRLSADG